MNQVLKDNVYGMGTVKQLEFMAQIGGMNEEETHMLKLMHDGKTDDYIRDTLCLDRSSHHRVESAVRAKLLLAVFQCINFTMEKI